MPQFRRLEDVAKSLVPAESDETMGMDYPCKYYPIRQSTRLALEIPLRVTSLGSEGPFSENCRTVVVNAHGCGLTSSRPLRRGTRVQLEIIENRQVTVARVVDVVPLDEGHRSWLIGLALEEPGNFWGIQYAPTDWNIENALEQDKTAVNRQIVEREHGNDRVAQSTSSNAKNCSAPCHLAAISIGACYLQTEITFSRQTPVVIRISLAQSESCFAGTVLVEHAQSGMGIEFTDHDHRDRIKTLIDTLCRGKNLHPQIQVERRWGFTSDPESRISNPGLAIAVTPEPHDSLLALILAGSRLTRNDFLRELERQRRSVR